MSTTRNEPDFNKTDWEYHGQKRPHFAINPTEGQESVWDYPRPPSLEAEEREVLVIFENKIIARSTNAMKIKETASPPAIYIPADDINKDYVKKTTGVTRCEWKGEAIFWNVIVDDKVAERAAWSYPQPKREYSKIKSHLAFYPAKLYCYLNGEHVKPQPGGFYGGWVTREIIGPFKGESDETFL